ASSTCWARAINAELTLAPWLTAARLVAPAVFFTVALFAVDFLAGAFLADFSTALRGRVEGSAFRRSANSSQARSSEIVSGVSPRRRVAFTSPSVTKRQKRPLRTNT